MYVIKEKSEDFRVEERSSVKPLKEGRYTYFILEKKNWNSLDAIKKISEKLRLQLKDFGFAGNKDKKAITSQVCSVRKKLKKDFELTRIKVKIIGYGDEPVHLGDLYGNHFEIIVRNVDKKPKIKKKFLNLFGEQRFGRENLEIGEALIKRDFKKAAEILKLEGSNYIGEIRRLPRKELIFYVHAYQSKLWNKAAELAKNSKIKELPMIGFGTEKIDKYSAKVISEENIIPRDFVVKEFPEISSEGSIRKLFVEAEELDISELEDGKIKLKFFLPKGSYATEFIKNLWS